MPDPMDPRLAELCQRYADDALDPSQEEELKPCCEMTLLCEVRSLPTVFTLNYCTRC